MFSQLTLGIEFRGGAEFRVSSPEATEAASLETVEESGVAGEIRVQQVGNDTIRVQTEKVTPELSQAITAALAERFNVSPDDVSSQVIGPSWGADISKKAVRALVIFLFLVVIFLSLYFEWKMAVAAMLALLHDLAITVGIYALVGFEVTPATVIGFLTILGYSLYDTVVVFDKVKENTAGIAGGSRMTYSDAANLAVNQTIVRSINTSIVALLPIGAILFAGVVLLGAGPLKDLALALFVGVAVGTYSSIFIATPHAREPEGARARHAGAGPPRPGARGWPSEDAHRQSGCDHGGGRVGRGARGPAAGARDRRSRRSRRRSAERPAARGRVHPQPAQAEEQEPSRRQEASLVTTELGGLDLTALLLERIRDVPDYPKPGILFKDIAPLLADHVAFAGAVDAIVNHHGRGTVDKVVGIEARGFILAAPVAYHTGAGFVPVRKKGKLPGATLETSYALEYGEATLEVAADAFEPGDRVLIVDDVLATGGTVEATIDLVRRAGADVVGLSVLMELSFLPGRERLSRVDGPPLHTLLTV